MKEHILASLMIFLLLGVSLVYAPPSGWRDEIRIVPGNDNQPYGNCCIITDLSVRIHTAMRKMTGDEPRCYDLDYYRSLDTAITWEDINHGASGGTGPVSYPSTDIIAIGNNIMMVFEQTSQFDIDFVKSTNGGDDWDDEETIVDGASSDRPLHPRFGLDGGYTHVFYAYPVAAGNYEIYRKDSTVANGWSTEDRVTDAARNSWHPAVSVNAGTIHVVWADNRLSETNYEIYYNKSTDHGGTWVHEDDYQFTEDADESDFPDIIAYTDPSYSAVHVVWQDERDDPGPGIYYRRSTDNGGTWGNPVRLCADGHHPAIAADERGLYVVWEKGSYINYKESTDWGSTWLATLRITNTLDADSFPDITADDLGRHIVFVRRAVGSSNSKVWYKQRDIVAPAAPQNLQEDPLVVPPPVILYWDANEEADLKEYWIYRKRESDLKYSQIGSTTDTTYTDNTFPQLGCWYLYYVTAIDLATNQSNPSNTIRVWVPNPGKRINFGESLASPYNIERDGYYGWGASFDSTADFGDNLRYRLTELIPENDYVFGFALFEPTFDSGRVLSIEFGSQNIVEDIAVPESVTYKCFLVPKPLYSSGVFDLGLNIATKEAVLSQIVIWEHTSGGPQNLQSVDTDNDFNLRIHPNPGIKNIGIEYNLHQCTDVELTIFDINGRLVEEITDAKQDAGIHTESVDITHLSQGVYFVRLKTAHHSAMQKVILVK
jgi:hypothetical protein